VADAYTATTSLDYSTKAYQRRAYFALRPELMYDQLADVFATEQSHPGTSVQFNVLGDLAIASTALNETQDVSAVAPTDSTVTATLNEYGNVILRTRALQGTSFIEIDPALADLIGFNAGVSIDEVAKNIVQAGTNVSYGGTQTARTGLTAGDVITAHNVRYVRAFLARNNAMKWIMGQGGGAAPTYSGPPNMDGAPFESLVQNPGTGWFAAMIHPDVALDLREQTGSGSWRVPSEYAGASNGGHQSGIWAGELGAFEGFRFVENSRAPFFQQGGSSSQNVYGTLFFGREAILKIWATVEGNGPVPQVVEGPITDRLRRFKPLGWYWFGAYGVFRQNNLYRYETASSIGGTSTTQDPSIDQ
jgi:N4-gp56 family major capsid protein